MGTVVKNHLEFPRIAAFTGNCGFIQSPRLRGAVLSSAASLPPLSLPLSPCPRLSSVAPRRGPMLCFRSVMCAVSGHSKSLGPSGSLWSRLGASYGFGSALLPGASHRSLPPRLLFDSRPDQLPHQVSLHLGTPGPTRKSCRSCSKNHTSHLELSLMFTLPPRPHWGARL